MVLTAFFFYFQKDHKWDEKTKALILSSFFWGYVVTQVPAGQLAQRCGAKRILLWSMLLCSALTLLTPLSVTYGGWKVSFQYCEFVTTNDIFQLNRNHFSF